MFRLAFLAFLSSAIFWGMASFAEELTPYVKAHFEAKSEFVLAKKGQRITKHLTKIDSTDWSMAVIDGRPKGKMWFNEKLGIWSFEASEDDSAPFTVGFIAIPENGVPITHAFRVKIEQNFLESDLLQEKRELPDRQDFTIVSETKSLSKKLFNTTEQHVRHIQIAGVEVIFDKNNGPLHKRFHDDKDIERLTIHAEKVIIRSELNLPGTQVIIYAQTLKFEGSEAKIITTPLPWEAQASQFQDGLMGHEAGSIYLNVENHILRIWS